MYICSVFCRHLNSKAYLVTYFFRLFLLGFVIKPEVAERRHLGTGAYPGNLRTQVVLFNTVKWRIRNDLEEFIERSFYIKTKTVQNVA